MPTIIKKPNILKKKPFERTLEGKIIEEIKIKDKNTLKNIEKVSIYKKQRGEYGGVILKEKIIGAAKQLATEAYITSAFINRISKQTSRKIIIIPIIRTGVMYTTYIKENKQVKIVPLEYPSNRDYFNPTHIQKLNKIQEEYKGSLFVFVDSSRSERMPAALGGAYLNEDYTSNRDSILGQLEKNNKKIKIATYQYAKTGIDRDFKKYINKTNRNFLPKYTHLELKDIDAILLNPSIERKKLLQYTAPNQNWNPDYSNWRSAPHDDRTEFQTKEFQDIVLHFANQMKKSYNKRLRNEIKR